MWKTIKYFILKYTDLYHRKIWRPFIKSKYGRLAERICRTVGKILWALEVVNPPKGEAPCFDEKTFVFTNEGWKLFKDLRGDELILTRLPNGETEWSPILAMQKYFYSGEMYHLQGRRIDLLITPDHNLYLSVNNCRKNCKFCIHKKYCNNGFIFKKVSEIKTTKYHIPTSFKWNGEKKEYFEIERIEFELLRKRGRFYKYIKVRKGNYKIPMKHWLAFLGLYLSEGCVIGNYIFISQKHTDEKDKFIREILEKLPYSFSKVPQGWRIKDIALAEYCRKFGKAKEKYIPQEIKNLSSDLLLILFESLIFGDGYEEGNGYYKYITKSYQLAQDVQEISFKIGFNAGIHRKKNGIYDVYIGYKKETIRLDHKFFKNNIKKVFYKGYVYDLTVKNHTLWVKRNDKCVWSGNCLAYLFIRFPNRWHGRSFKERMKYIKKVIKNF